MHPGMGGPKEPCPRPPSSTERILLKTASRESQNRPRALSKRLGLGTQASSRSTTQLQGTKSLNRVKPRGGAAPQLASFPSNRPV